MSVVSVISNEAGKLLKPQVSGQSSRGTEPAFSAWSALGHNLLAALPIHPNHEERRVIMSTSPSTSRQIALVTGAGTGIGKAVALALLDAGYRVVLAGRRVEPLEDVARESGTDRALAVATDVSRPDSVAALFAEIRAKLGRLDLLFNNAGVSGIGMNFEDIPFEQWQNIVNINLTGSFLCAQGAFRLMKEQSPQGGRIINNGSISAHAPRPNSAPYTATKHAITGLTKSLSLDGRKYDIACGQIDIGNAMTDMAAKMAKGVPQASGEIAIEAMMDVKEVANAVVHMASLPLSANVQFMTVMATKMPFVGRG
jgi:NAD(P)-dependent dehydrogenase (short-subunit alcohol dehydrogenase family)